MDTINRHVVLLNCLDWQHEGLSDALSIAPDMALYPHLQDRQQEITQQIEAALQGIEELRQAVQDSSPPIE